MNTTHTRPLWLLRLQAAANWLRYRVARWIAPCPTKEDDLYDQAFTLVASGRLWGDLTTAEVILLLGVSNLATAAAEESTFAPELREQIRSGNPTQRIYMAAVVGRETVKAAQSGPLSRRPVHEVFQLLRPAETPAGTNDFGGHT